MRRTLIFLALMLLPGALRAQGISLADLQGATIHTVNTYSGTFRGDSGATGPGRIEVRRQMRVGQDGTISWSYTRTASGEGAKGTKSGQLSGSGTGKLGTPQNRGDGSVLWVLEGNTLVQMRTYESGGHMQRITLSRGGGGLTCKSNLPLVREVGGGLIKGQGAIHSKVEILEIRPTGSSCSVSK